MFYYFTHLDDDDKRTFISQITFEYCQQSYNYYLYWIFIKLHDGHVTVSHLNTISSSSTTENSIEKQCLLHVGKYKYEKFYYLDLHLVFICVLSK